jgi:hypothetical protein
MKDFEILSASISSLRVVPALRRLRTNWRISVPYRVRLPPRAIMKNYNTKNAKKIGMKTRRRGQSHRSRRVDNLERDGNGHRPNLALRHFRGVVPSPKFLDFCK